MRLLWLAPTAIAAACDTLADIISDEVVASEDDSEDEDEEAAKKQMLPGEAEELRGMAETRPCCCPEIPEKQKLTGEQDFMVSMVPMLTASIAILATHPAGTPLDSPLALANSSLGAAIFLAGIAYAFGYLALLKAWESVPSTVIVPCLQLSSPMVELMVAALAPHHTAHALLAPLASSQGLTLRSCASFLIVFVGGMMPSVGEGSLSELCRLDLWRQTSMMWMMGGNLAFSVFYVLMGLITSPEPAPECRLSNAGFMACTNGVAVAAFSCFVAVQPSLRMQFASAYGLNTAGASSNGRRGGRREEQPKVHWAARAMSMAAECCNYVAMFAISFAFNLHPNAGLVAAGRASLNQMTNCVCAWLLHHCYRFGRPVEGLGMKILSAVIVTVGLLLASSQPSGGAGHTHTGSGR